MEAIKNNEKRLFSIRLAKKAIIYLVGILVFDFLFFAFPVIANRPVEVANAGEISLEAVFEEDESLADSIINNLPENQVWQVKATSVRTITAYNSEIGQTDASPCITANGFNVCEHGEEDTIAANFLRFGTKVRIPELFGDRVFIVRDRMNEKHPSRMDVWMNRKIDAKTFGVQRAEIEILE